MFFVFEGGAAFSNKGSLFDVGRASGTKLCRLLWNTNLVEIELSSLCLPWSLY